MTEFVQAAGAHFGRLEMNYDRFKMNYDRFKVQMAGVRGDLFERRICE